MMSDTTRMHKVFQLAIFDLDGTLLDTLSDLANAVNAALEQNGLQAIEREAYRYLVGSGIRNLCWQAVERQAFLPIRKEDLVEKVLRDFRDIYGRTWAKETTAYPGIYLLLRQLSDAGTATAILSNKADDLVRDICEHYFPEQHFAFVSGLRREWPKKPDPTLLLHLVETYSAALPGLDAKQICYIGDSASDMEIARRAAYTGIGVTWGFRTEEELRSSGAKFICHDAAELAALILGNVPL